MCDMLSDVYMFCVKVQTSIEFVLSDTFIVLQILKHLAQIDSRPAMNVSDCIYQYGQLCKNALWIEEKSGCIVIFAWS